MLRRFIAGGRLPGIIAAIAIAASAASGGVARDDGARIREQPAAATITSRLVERVPGPRGSAVALPAVASPVPSPVPQPPPTVPQPSPVPQRPAVPPDPATAIAPPVLPDPPACGPYPIVLSPEPELHPATGEAAGLWNSYAGCPLFAVGPGGILVAYASDWPGDCLKADIVACTSTAIWIEPSAGRLYEPAGVIAHEMGHLLNIPHDSPISIMDPDNWDGPSTLWCSLFTRCR